MIGVRGLEARAGAFRLGPVDLSVPRGRLLVILGPSGAGKTLLLETLLGLREADRGTIVLAGRDVTRLPPEARDIAYLPQDVALFPHLSVRENVLFGPRVRGNLASAEADLERLAGLLQVRHLLARTNIASLSGGERQRVALARAMVTNPKVLFLDESFSSLDAHVRRQLMAQTKELQRSSEATIVYVTHQQRDVAIADGVAVVMDGRVVQAGEPGELLRRPVDLRVARFLQLDNLFEVDTVGTSECAVRGVPLRLAAPPPRAGSGRLWLGIGSAEVVLLRPGEAERLGLNTNVLRGRVEEVDGKQRLRRGARVAVAGSAGLALRCEVSARDRAHLGGELQVGDEVVLYLPPQALSVFPERADGA